MKKLISWLIHRESHVTPAVKDTNQWWRLEETKHSDPPEERTGLYVWPQLLAALKSKMGKWGE